MTSTNININENFKQASLPQSIIWPENPDDIPWFMANLYQNLAQAINFRDFVHFPMAIGTTPTPIQNMTNFGAYMICVGGTNQVVQPSGVISWLPSAVWIVAKTQDTVAGTLPAATTSQPGVGGGWAGSNLALTSMLVNGRQVYALNHNATGLTGSFNVRIVGTQ